MQIKEKIENNIVILTLQGSLQSEPDAILLRETVNRCVEKGFIRVIFDLGNLNYLNSWGLGLLVALLSMIRRVGGDIRLVSIKGNVRNLFIVTQLTKVFESYDDAQSALTSFTPENSPPA